MLSPKKFLKSFQRAIRGFRVVWRDEQSFRIEIIAAAGVLCVASLLHVSLFDFFILCALVAGVIILEIMNSVIERCIDLIKPRLHEHVGMIKDMMASAVLLMAIIAAIVGISILGRYIV